MRGATLYKAKIFNAEIFQSTRPVRGATISIGPFSLTLAFQSTRPVRGATNVVIGGELIQSISIHAPRAGRDVHICAFSLELGHFNPRAPCGARPVTALFHDLTKVFQSTRPVRGATVNYEALLTKSIFQSTRPVRGATRIQVPKK